jgi:hypothetical protein
LGDRRGLGLGQQNGEGEVVEHFRHCVLLVLKKENTDLTVPAPAKASH